jgi:DNA-binding NarL/FixJ family response regulator
MRAGTRLSPQVERGLILVDSSWAIIALDPGAAAILDYTGDRSGNIEGTYAIDKNILAAVRHGSNPVRLENVSPGIGEFTCRTFLFEHIDPSFLEHLGASVTQPLVALGLERQLEARDPIDEVGARYHLTKREQQALKGFSMGLSIKALAATMNIKPSTLRAFMRLIKIKMGATTRAGIMVKILENEQD